MNMNNVNWAESFPLGKTIELIRDKQFKTALEAAEQKIYMEAYEYTGRNQSVTAKLLGVSRGTFRTKLKEWGVLTQKDYTNRVINEMFGLE